MYGRPQIPRGGGCDAQSWWDSSLQTTKASTNIRRGNSALPDQCLLLLSAAAATAPAPVLVFSNRVRCYLREQCHTTQWHSLFHVLWWGTVIGMSKQMWYTDAVTSGALLYDFLCFCRAMKNWTRAFCLGYWCSVTQKCGGCQNLHTLTNQRYDTIVQVFH